MLQADSSNAVSKFCRADASRAARPRELISTNTVMAPGRNEAFAEADVILNRLNVTLARRQGLLASLIGVSSREEIERKSSHVDSYQDEDSFSADPELCVSSHRLGFRNRLI